MDIALLGPLVVRTAAGEAVVSAGKQRAVVELLALRADRAVMMESLCAGLWGDSPPVSATKAVQTYVSHLRRVLPPDSLHTVGDGYVLLAGGSVDAARFEDALGRCTELREDGDLQSSLENLVEGLRLWRGRACSDLTEHSWATAEVVRLEELRRAAEEDLADIRLAMGEHAHMVGDLEAAVAAEPLRERRWSQLMLSLYRSGRQADALRAFARLRSVLGEELGIDPSAGLVDLESAILMQSPELGYCPPTSMSSQAAPELVQDRPRAPWANASVPQDNRVERDQETRAARKPPRVAPVPLPDRLVVKSWLGFVGREREYSSLRRAWEAARSGERRLVLFSGDAGLGKTRISAEFAREAFEAGDLVLYGCCDEDLTSSYRPWVEALAYYARKVAAPDEKLLDVRTLGDLAALVHTILGSSTTKGQVLPSETASDQYALFAAVAEILRYLAEGRTAVFVLDDLHWADRGSLMLLRHVLAQTASDRILLIGCYRPSDVEDDRSFSTMLAAIHREVGVDRVELVGLSELEILSMLEAAPGHGLGDEGVRLARVLRNETEDNPFFIGEMLRHLVENGTIVRHDGQWVATGALADAGLPRSVREVVTARLRRLGEEVDGLLSAAAVAGREFEVAAAAHAVDLDEDAALKLLERAMAAGLVTELPGPDDRFVFTHALVQRTLYQNLPKARRVRLHRKIAEAVEALAGDNIDDRAAELATHWFAVARPGSAEKAVRYGIRAGDRALSGLAPDEAIRWYREVLDAIPDEHSERYCDVLVRLGGAMQQAGEAEHREVLLGAAALAQRLSSSDLLIKAALANYRGGQSQTGAPDTDKILVLETALALTSGDCRERALLLAHLAGELSSSGDELLPRRLAMADEAVAIARRLEDPATLTAVLVDGVFATWIPERLDRRVAWAEEASRLASMLSDPILDWRVSSPRQLVAIEVQDRDTYDVYQAHMVSLAGRIRQPAMQWATATSEATRRFLDGDLDGAEAVAAEALDLGLSSSQPDALSWYGAQLFTIRTFQGRNGELEELVRQEALANPGIPSFRVALAVIYGDSGRTDEAIDLIAGDIANGFASFPMDPLWLVNLTGIARSVMALHQTAPTGRTELFAAPLYEALAPWRDRLIFVGVVAWPPVAHYLGMLAGVLGRKNEAEDDFEAALEIATRIRAPLFGAMTQVEWGSFLLDGGRNDLERARQLIHSGLQVAVARGAGGIERRAQDLIRRRL